VAQPVPEIHLRDTLSLAVAVNLNGLNPEDIVVECLVGDFAQQQFVADRCVRLVHQSGEHFQARFEMDWTPDDCGLKQYRLRVYPYHHLLSHPFELGLMFWL
jgi:starch phosphorylase